MTNILATVALIVSTNWTDQIHDGKQLGYAVTNHVANIVYQDSTNTLTLKQDTGPFVWGGTRKEIGTNMSGELHAWYWITNGGFMHQNVYEKGHWVSSANWGGLY